VRRIHFRVGQRFVRRAIGEGVRQALLAFGHALAAKDVEQFHVLQIRRLGLLHGLQHRFVRRRFRHQHRHVAAAGGKLRQRLERFRGLRLASSKSRLNSARNTASRKSYFFASAGSNWPSSPSGNLPPSVTAADSSNSAVLSARLAKNNAAQTELLQQILNEPFKS
jgi:hypothetical protein